MKKQILYSAIFLIISLNASANPFTAAINIRTADNDAMTVIFDGVAYPNTTCDFRVENITPGNHHIKVLTRENWGWKASRFSRMVFNGWMNLNPGEEIYATIDYFGHLKIDRVVKFCPPAPQPVCHDNHYGFHKDCNTYPLPYNYNSAMSPENFYALKQTIMHCNFESSRLDCAKLALANNYFTAQQIADIMGLFWFESSKLEFAISAYSRVVDSQNYYQVYNQFSFSSSAEALNQCLSIRR